MMDGETVKSSTVTFTVACNHDWVVDITSADGPAGKWAMTYEDDSGVKHYIPYDIAFNDQDGSLTGECSSQNGDGHDDGEIGGCVLDKNTVSPTLRIKMKDTFDKNIPSGTYEDVLTISIRRD